MKQINFLGKKNIVGGRVKTARKSAGVSQQELASRLQTLGINIDQQMICRIENGQRLVTDYEVAGLCRVLSIDSRWLLEAFDEKQG